MATRTATRDTSTPADLVREARRRFVAGERIDIAGLGAAIGVSRATAYRWAGNADELIGNVIASLAEETFVRARRRARGRGWRRVLAVVEEGMRGIATYEPYQEFLARDPEHALRIVASKEGAPQRTMIRLHQALIEEEAARGHIALPVDAHTLAYAVVRLAESFLYADLIAGEEPDIGKAMQVLRLVCRD